MNKIYYFIGQSGSGKTTLSNMLNNFLNQTCIQIDGDDIREIFNNKDYSIKGRRTNVELAHNIAKFLIKKENNVIISLVSPFKDLRDELKKENVVIEIYLHTTENRGRNEYHVNYFEIPTENYIDIDTTNKTDEESFTNLLIKLKLQ